MRGNFIVGKQLSLSVLVSVLIVLAFGLTSPAEPGVSGEIRGGYHMDAEEGLVGGGLNVDLGNAWYFNPNAEWVFVEGYDFWSLNADFHRDLNASGPAVWLGAGPAILFFERDGVFGGRDDTDMGVNLFGGVGARQGGVRPFAQMKVTLSDNSSGSLAFGMRF